MTRILRAVCVVLAASFPAYAQDSTIEGTVVDATHGRLSDATVVAQHVATQRKYETTTSREGLFTLLAVSAGRYEVTVHRAGYAPWSMSNLQVLVGQTARIEVTLQLEAVTETVEVTAAPAVRRWDGSLSFNIDPDVVEQAPLNGRTLQHLLVLVPGVTYTNASRSPGQFTVNGQRATANYLTVDGVSANVGTDRAGSTANHNGSGSVQAFSATGTTSSLVAADALQEIEILTSSMAPEFGRTPGGTIRLVTKSGTNSYHGGGAAFYRNDSLTATDWFANNRGLPKTKLEVVNLSVTGGGPLRKGRSWFFGSYEEQRLDLPRTVLSNGPSPGLLAAADSTRRALLESFPVGTGTVRNDGWAELPASFTDPSRNRSGSLRLDLALPGNANLFARGHVSHSSSQLRGLGSTAYAVNALSDESVKTDTLTIGATSPLPKQWLLESRLGLAMNRIETVLTNDGFGGARPLAATAVIPGTLSERSVFLNVRILTGLAGGQSQLGYAGGSDLTQWNWLATVMRPIGTHLVKGGIDVRTLRTDLNPRNYSVILTAAGATGPVSGNISAFSEASPTFLNASTFLQDTWAIRENVTLTYGVRWDVNPAPSAETELQPVIATNVTQPNAIAIRQDIDPLYETRWTNVAPRAGVSWMIGSFAGAATTLTGGAGLFNDTGHTAVAGPYGGGFPFQRTRPFSSPTIPLAGDLFSFGPLPAVPGSSQVYAIPEDIRSPRVVHWNVGLSLARGSQQLGVYYVGARGRHLQVAEWIQNARFNPSFELIRSVLDRGRSQYRALQTTYSGRPFRDLVLQANYTFGSAKDTASDDFNNLNPSFRVSSDSDWSWADYDVRHTYSARMSWSTTDDRTSRAWSALLRDWSLDAIVVGRSGATITPAIPRDIGYGLWLFRPDQVPGVPPYVKDAGVPGGTRVNPAAFVAPAEARQGTAPRNGIRSLPVWQIDLGLERRVLRLSSAELSVRAEVFNATNRANFGPYRDRVTDPLFGQSTSMLANSLGNGTATEGLSPLFQWGGPRTIQLAVRARF